MEAGELESENATLQERVDVLVAALEAERREKRDLVHYIDYPRRRVFGPKGERLDPDQLQIPFEDLVDVIEAERPSVPLTEATEAPDAESPEDKIPKRFRRKGAHGRKALPDELPRVRIVHALDEDERCCPSCSKSMARIGGVVTEEVDYVPTSVVVREHVRPKDACRGCQAGVLIAPAPPQVIDKGRTGAGLLARVLVSKYADHRVPRRIADQPQGWRSRPCCMDDEGRPLGIGVQAQVPNRLELRGLRAQVVSVEGKGAA
ncbi:IS66 family transposase zinc-finger binding domain-containing protein [Engelhardtia mirabilis]|uniref:Putative Helix-turn-helix domain of transposase IS66 n=1 Tax=Engelhardtia mirabilis TaxID=2528011 RepID=A0A518BS80_9BACT|nr:putative Helix-turn-helix domain of transposase IS66 [Planctomycetes bacterium Pla133]QDV04158.1 putative Helix-turn-helix domain of transposase IS66 [Planctomycetes bacterium Pla86]